MPAAAHSPRSAAARVLPAARGGEEEEEAAGRAAVPPTAARVTVYLQSSPPGFTFGWVRGFSRDAARALGLAGARPELGVLIATQEGQGIQCFRASADSYAGRGGFAKEGDPSALVVAHVVGRPAAGAAGALADALLPPLRPAGVRRDTIQVTVVEVGAHCYITDPPGRCDVTDSAASLAGAMRVTVSVYQLSMNRLWMRALARDAAAAAGAADTRRVSLIVQVGNGQGMQCFRAGGTSGGFHVDGEACALVTVEGAGLAPARRYQVAGVIARALEEKDLRRRHMQFVFAEPAAVADEVAAAVARWVGIPRERVQALCHRVPAAQVSSRPLETCDGDEDGAGAALATVSMLSAPSNFNYGWVRGGCGALSEALCRPWRALGLALQLREGQGEQCYGDVGRGDAARGGFACDGEASALVTLYLADSTPLLMFRGQELRDPNQTLEDAGLPQGTEVELGREPVGGYPPAAATGPHQLYVRSPAGGSVCVEVALDSTVGGVAALAARYLAA